MYVVCILMRLLPYPSVPDFWQIKLENQLWWTGFLVYFNVDYGFIACYKQFRNILLQDENQVRRTRFFRLDFSKTKDRWIGRKCCNHSLTDVKELHFIHTKRLFHAIQQNSLLTLIGMSSENKKNAPRSKFYNTQWAW